MDDLRDMLARLGDTELDALLAVIDGTEAAIDASVRRLDTIERLEAVAAKLEGAGEEPQPITSWRDAAEVLGIHPNTLTRRRQDRGDESRPWFASEDDLRRWWGALLSGRTASPTRPTRATKKPAAKATAGPTLAELRKRKKR